ncbi:MAG: response regulator [Acidimicrobiia bacterium]|nr:response regulator [Acidimicrobiia bacterium]
MTPGPVKALVVTGRPGVAGALASALEASGMECDVAPDADAALRATDADPPDAVVLDLGMPALDGWLLLAQIGARAGRPRLIVCSAPTKIDEQQRAFDLGADAFAPGPFDPHYVARTVREVVERDRAPMPERP